MGRPGQLLLLAATWMAVLLCADGSESWLEAQTKHRNLVFANYDKVTKPANVTNVTITSPHIISIDLDIGSSRLDVAGILAMSWVDPRLSWDEERSAGTDHPLVVPADWVWKPDIQVYNARNLEDYVPQGKSVVVVYPSGEVSWNAPVRLHTICATDGLHWPLDQQVCKIKLGSWTHSGWDIDIQVEGEVDLEYFDPKASGWAVLNATMQVNTIYYQCCPEPYIDATLRLTLQRNSSTLTSVIWTPAVCLTLLNLVLFLLPPGAGEKITFGGLCLVLDLILLAFVNHLANPPPTENNPYIVLYVAKLLSSSAISVVLSAMVVRLAQGPHPTAPWAWLQKFTGGASCCLGLGNYRALASATDEGEEPSAKHHHATYVALAAIIDRILFILTVIGCINYAVAFALIL